jgi:hypothetical protein
MHWFATFLKDKNVHVTNLSTSDSKKIDEELLPAFLMKYYSPYLLKFPVKVIF